MKLLLGDCLNKLKELEDNSIDSIVTDPPYGLSFMGKDWDKVKATKETKSQVVKGLGAGMKMTTLADNIEFEKWVTEWSMECMRVLKPGGYMLAFGGSRMYHRLASGVENAGFEIRDQMMWIYGSGFPKSMDISKQIDKKGGQNLSWFIDYVLEIAEEKNISKKELTMLFPSKNGKPTGWLWNKKNSQGITLEQYNTLKDFLDLPFDSVEEAEREVIGRGKAGLTGGTIANFSGEMEFDITAPSTDEAKKWEGWGTALKPAHEPIVMARKPLSENTVADNVIEWGTGGLNIDESRIENTDTLDRFPANVIFDEEAGKLLDGQCDGVSRFFYCPKTSKKDRNEGNIHPTVKPTDLMLYLIRLVTPKGGTTLDPFMGSGSTGKAAIRGGFDFIGIERDNEYMEIAKSRINYEISNPHKEETDKKVEVVDKLNQFFV